MNMISTRGRYALRVLIDLAEHGGGNYLAMKDVVDRQGISLKYLEKILPVLTKEGIIEGVRGKGGGYRLTKSPDSFTVWDILQATEGDLAPVTCLEENASPCERAAECRTLPMWKEYYERTKKYFSGITLADLTSRDTLSEYVI